MDIKNPEYILEIARQQSVTRAAQKLFITQSTLSQYLLKLESELNTPLFIREKNRLVPTGAGQVYIQAAQAVVKIQDAAQARIAALKDEGSIRLGSSAWGLDLVVDTLPAFKERFPAFTVRIYENRYAETKAMMRAGTLDLAIIAVTEDDDLPAQGYTPLCQEELSLILPVDHPFCTAAPGRTHITVDVLSHELGGVSYLFSDVGSTIRKIEEKIFENLMFRPNVVCEMNRDDFTLTYAGEEWMLMDDEDAAKLVTWASDDTDVCTVKDGLVTAVGSGAAKIIATYNGKSVECWVRCSF